MKSVLIYNMPIFQSYLRTIMVSSNQRLFHVECSGFEVVLNCSEPLSRWVRTSCCEEYADVTHNAAPHVSLRAWYDCCDSLTDSGLGSAQPKWEKSSYHAYIMGIAVFGILLCLFISGARSMRRRRLAMMVRMNNQSLQEISESLSGNPRHRNNTQVSLGPPTYGELEASGLTKDYKMDDIAPPPYPGNVDEQGEAIQCVLAVRYSGAGGENATTVTIPNAHKDDGITETQNNDAITNASNEPSSMNNDAADD